MTTPPPSGPVRPAPFPSDRREAILRESAIRARRRRLHTRPLVPPECYLADQQRLRERGDHRE